MPATVEILPPRYRDIRRLAAGEISEVLQAIDRELGRVVALKILSQRYAEDPVLRTRFEYAGLAAARLSGAPNVVTIFDVTEHNGRPIIVMEYLPGGSLEEVSKGRATPAGQALQWLREAADALDAGHAAGVVHGDVKPGNMLLDAEARVYVADFGIANALRGDSPSRPVAGTAGYLSPEQAVGEDATAAGDRYALAVVAWELLVGRRPFTAPSPTAEAWAHVNAPIPSASQANPAVPEEVDWVFERALAKNPAARYRTSTEFVGDLRRAFEDAAGGAARFRESRRRAWWIPLLFALLLLGGGAAALLATRDSGHNPAPAPRTVVQTVTAPGVTVRETVTTAPVVPATTAPAVPATTAVATAPATQPATQPTTSGTGQDLNNAGYARMQAGDYAGALPLLEQAVQKLNGTGVIDEAYAKYNLAYTRFALGQCTDVKALADQAEAIEGHRVQIDRLRARADARC